MIELFRTLRTAVFPPRCACELAKPLNEKSAHGLCAQCFEVLETSRAEDAAYAPFVYGGALASMVVAAKFRRREDSAIALGHLLAEDSRAQELVSGVDALVPVPLSPRRFWRRGFNQAEAIAGVCSRTWGIRVEMLLLRRRDTAPQSGLAAQERSKNVQDAFVARPSPHRKVALIDDVTTSGETLGACSRALADAGITVQAALAVCRAESHPSVAERAKK